MTALQAIAVIRPTLAAFFLQGMYTSDYKWDTFGIRLEGTVHVDGAAVMARVKRERDRFVGFVLKGVDNIPADHKLRGHAKFLDDHSLQVDDHTVVTFGSRMFEHRVPVAKCALGGIQREALAGV